MDKTITVEVEREFEHPLYEKRIRRDSNLMAHDEDEVADPGDRVQIVETRPQSSQKRWLLDEILVKQEEQALDIEDETEDEEDDEDINTDESADTGEETAEDDTETDEE